jgi:hypothetical protein
LVCPLLGASNCIPLGTSPAGSEDFEPASTYQQPIPFCGSTKPPHTAQTSKIRDVDFSRFDPGPGWSEAALSLCSCRCVMLVDMDNAQMEERFDRLENQIEALTKHVDVLARTMEREFRDLHHSINYRFERVNGRLETIEGKIEAFARRVDDEAEARHVLGERVSKLEKTL